MVSGLNGGFDQVHDWSECLFQNMTKAELQGLKSPLIGPYRYARLALPCDTRSQPWPCRCESFKRLIKVGARVFYDARRWHVHVAPAFPPAAHYRAVLARGS